MSSSSSSRRRRINRNSSFSDYEGEGDDTGLVKDESSSELHSLTHKPVSTKSVIIRSATASILSIFFLLILQAGHFYCILLGVITQTEIYRELVNVRYVEARERSMPWFRTLQWTWFTAAMVTVYGESLHNFCAEHRLQLTAITRHSSSIGFIAYCVLFVASVLTLKKKLLRFQISQFMWSIIIICMVVFQCKFFAANTLNGLFWFFFPVATVVMNDVSAYFCGITFGRRFIKVPFLPLSPNKTWEGFIGAAIGTLIFSFFFPRLLAQFNWFICPADNLYLSPFPPRLTCTPRAIFTDFFPVTVPVIGAKFMVLPIQIHGLGYGLFASLVAPFGGFFASAIKRAYNKKDFDSFVPGHGGAMDRMDCQLLMLAYTSFHYSNFVAPNPNLQRMEFLASLMSTEDQIKLLEALKTMVNISAMSSR